MNVWVSKVMAVVARCRRSALADNMALQPLAVNGLRADLASSRQSADSQGTQAKKSCQLPASSSQLLKIGHLDIENALPGLTHQVKPARRENLDKATAGG